MLYSPTSGEHGRATAQADFQAEADLWHALLSTGTWLEAPAAFDVRLTACIFGWPVWTQGLLTQLVVRADKGARNATITKPRWVVPGSLKHGHLESG